MTDLEYVDDMALISKSYESLYTLLESLDSSCQQTYGAYQQLQEDEASYCHTWR